MNDQKAYIEILERVSALTTADAGEETVRRINRRLMILAAAGAIRAGVPVRVSDDGLFLTIDLGGRSYTVIASSVEAVLREDYDRALSVCRYMAAEVYEKMREELPEERAKDPEGSCRPSETGGQSGLRILPQTERLTGKEQLRFESRAAKKNTAIPLPEDRGEGGVPPCLPSGGKRFCPAGERTEQIRKRVTVTRHGGLNRKKVFLFLADLPERSEVGSFAGFSLAVKKYGTEELLFQGSFPGEGELVAADTHFRVIVIQKDGGFHLGIMLGGASAETCFMEIHDE